MDKVKMSYLLKLELAEVKKNELLAVIFGEREKVFQYRKEKKEIEKQIEEYENNDSIVVKEKLKDKKLLAILEEFEEAKKKAEE